MKRLLFSLSTSILCLFLCTDKALAQRTSNGSLFIGVCQTVPAYVIPSGGLELHLGQYLLSSYWKASIGAIDWMQKTDTEGIVFDHLHLMAEGSYMQRVACNYPRSFNLYAGSSAFIGYNMYEVLAPLPDEFSSGLPDGEFIYGLKPSIEIEWFLSARAALLLGIHAPITFSSSLSTDMWHASASFGVRINL